MTKQKQRRAPRAKWFWILCIQMISMLALYSLFSLSIIPGGILYSACRWLLVPAAGFLSACMSTRRGLLNYVAWIIPPAMQVCANLLIWGYSPSVGSVFLCAFISLVGAATGEVLRRQPKR